ncbi:unnamed protein product [Ambrosiozyma monospora]|uniref:Unnamed protein product n=1 Tax=Ambrosiozyma monospora TaxID=43982 RepID=A0A9W6YYN1_AMBMO|nr:unnamed protein product [Ambrosiozyma monospora]
MTNTTVKQLIEEIQENGYEKQPWILNTNEDLFTGPNNLKQKGKIESVQIYSKLIYSQDEIDYLNGTSGGEVVKYLSSNETEKIGNGGGQECAHGNENGNKTADGDQDLNRIPISNHLLGFFKLGKKLTSHLNIVHGGAIATLIDEFFVKVCLPLTPKHFAVTANLNIKYQKPLKFEKDGEPLLDVLLDCYIKYNKDNRKFTVCGGLKNVEGDYVYCFGEVLVVVPRVGPDQL